MEISQIKIGKIKSVSFGLGGYQDAMIGLSVDLGGQSWGVTDFIGQWASEHTEHCNWTEEERLLGLGKDVMSLVDLLVKAKVKKVSELKDIPVEVTLKSRTLKSWRILEEVL